MFTELVFKEKKFFPLFWTQFFGALNDNFFKNALVMFITYKSVVLWGLGSASLVAMAGGVFILPFFIFSATAGQIADKFDKSDVIRNVKKLELIIMLVAGFGFYLDNYYILMVVLFLMGTQSAFFGPCKYGVIPELVGEDDLVSANAVVASGSFVAILIGTTLGGIATGLEDAAHFVSLGVIVFALVGIYASRKHVKVEARDPKIKIDYSLFKPTWDILKITRKNKKVFYAVMGISWFWFLGAAILSLLPGLCKEIFGGNETVSTAFLAMFTIGMGFGAFFCEKLSGKKVEMGIVPWASLWMSIFMIDLFYVGYTWSAGTSESLISIQEFVTQNNSIRALFDLFMISSFGGMFIIPQLAYIQKFSKRDEVARTIAGNNIWNAIFMVTAAGILMKLHSLDFTIPQIFCIFAITNFFFAIFIFFKHSKDTWRFNCWFLTHLLYDLEEVGVEKIPEEGAVILCCNHISFVDWLMVMSVSPRPVRFIIDHAFYYVKTGPFWFKQADLVPIATRRESPEILEKAYKTISDRLDNGHILGLFPEGFISRNGQMRRFQPGLNKIISNNPVPIIPIALEGLWGSFFSFHGKGPLKGRISFRRRKVKITVMDPINPQDLDMHDLEDKIHYHMSIKSLFMEERERTVNELPQQ